MRVLSLPITVLLFATSSFYLTQSSGAGGSDPLGENGVAHEQTSKRTYLSFPRFSLDELLARADEVVLGTVHSLGPAEFDHPDPFQAYRVEVEIAARDGDVEAIELRIPGDEGHAFVGAPNPGPGERALLVLSQLDDGAFVLVGLGQGYLRAIDTAGKPVAFGDSSASGQEVPSLMQRFHELKAR